MRTTTIRPNGTNRTFGVDEVIVSKTDLKGRITYVNDVFLRISHYEEHEVIGQPQSLIRHPDMPRTVFKLLWSEIEAGREIFAYVLNLARDGAHYWVLAHVTPTVQDGRIIGYHSNRRSPHASSVAAVAPLYAALLQEERRHQSPVDALRAGVGLLEQTLAERDLTYDQFVWSITKVAA